MDRGKESNSETALDAAERTESAYFDENYEPHDHKPTGKSASNFEAISLLIKSVVGTGILGMPRAFYNAGYILGTFGTIFIGIITATTSHLIAESEHELCRRKRIPRMTYPETVEAAFEQGPRNVRRFKYIARVICSSFLVMMEFSGGCVYLIFIAENIKEVCDHLFSPAPLKFYLVCLLGPLTLLCWIKNLKNLAPGATIGTSCATVCIGAVYFFIFSEPISLEGRKATGPLKSFALFFGTSMFALAAFAEIMPIKNRMTKPANFSSVCGVVNVAMVPITLLYLTMGIFGYLAYGANTQNPITLNLPQTGIFGDLIRGLLAGSVFLSFPIGFYVVVEELWHKNLKLKFGHSKYLDQWEYGIRTVLTFTTVLCCIAIPNLELFMALVGSLMMPAVGLWFPAIMHTLTFWNEYTGFKRVLLIFKISVFILTGVFALVVSVSVTLLEIYETVL